MRFTLVLFSSISFATAQINIYHRLFHPTVPQSPFSHRGTVTVTDGNSVAFQSSSSFPDDLDLFTEAVNAIRDPDHLLYQVALEHPGDITEAQWDISSVKICHLSLATSETIYLHTLDLDNPIPHAIDYFVSPTPLDGACLKSRSNSAAKTYLFHSLAKNLNTTVVLRGASLPPIPGLTSPPPLSPEGAPIVPVQEKTFLQKYWMYIVALALFSLLTGGGEEETPRRQD